jgi:hypothetical protein
MRISRLITVTYLQVVFYCCGMGLSREPLSDTFISRFARLPQSGFFDVFFLNWKGEGSAFNSIFSALAMAMVAS